MPRFLVPPRFVGLGKSTLLVALFRLVPICGGAVLVDGVDTRRVGLLTLRRACAVVPQEPLLMKGSLRFNLDPTGEHSTARGGGPTHRAV